MSSLWDIGNALDNVSVSLHQIENLLLIYDERIEEDLKFIQDHVSDGYIRCFVERYDMLRSLLDIIRICTNDTAASLQEQVNAINAAIIEERQSAT